MKLNTVYWKYLKSQDDIITQKNPPKNGWFVKENVMDLRGGTTEHWFEVYHTVSGMKVFEKKFTAHCGYDRGPKRGKIIYTMLLAARSGCY